MKSAFPVPPSPEPGLLAVAISVWVGERSPDTSLSAFHTLDGSSRTRIWASWILGPTYSRWGPRIDSINLRSQPRPPWIACSVTRPAGDANAQKRLRSPAPECTVLIKLKNYKSYTEWVKRMSFAFLLPKKRKGTDLTWARTPCK